MQVFVIYIDENIFEYVERKYQQVNYHVDRHDYEQDNQHMLLDNEYEQDHMELNNYPKWIYRVIQCNLSCLDGDTKDPHDDTCARVRG